MMGVERRPHPLSHFRIQPMSSYKTLDMISKPESKVSTNHGMWTSRTFTRMKSQDILLLFKMASLYAQEENLLIDNEQLDRAVESAMQAPDWEYNRTGRFLRPSGPEYPDTDSAPALSYSNVAKEARLILMAGESWEGWTDPVEPGDAARSSWSDRYSVRALSASLGLSKSEVSNAMGRCRESGLLINDHATGLPKVNRRELLKLAEHALKYFFPVRPGALVRGIPTCFAAPALNRSIRSAGETLYVWPDPLGVERGQLIEPLYKTVPHAVKQDRTLYHYLALVDAIRVGGPRETSVAVGILKAGMGLK